MTQPAPWRSAPGFVARPPLADPWAQFGAAETVRLAGPPRQRPDGGRLVGVVFLWAVAVAVVLATAAFTRIGPVVYVIDQRHGVHAFDALVAVGAFGMASLVTFGIVRRRRRVPGSYPGASALPARPPGRPPARPPAALPTYRPAARRPAPPSRAGWAARPCPPYDATTLMIARPSGKPPVSRSLAYAGSSRR